MNIEKLSQIIIPRTHTNRGEDILIQVEPATDEWLLSSQRTREQIDRVLEGRLTGIQNTFGTDQAKQSEKVNVYLPRFLAYVELVDQYTVAEKSYKARAARETTLYRQEVTDIRGTTKKQSKIKRQIGDSQKAHGQIISDRSRKEFHAREVKKLILAKAVMEFFSATRDSQEPPLVTDQFHKLIEEAKQIFNQSEHASDARRTRQPVDQFLEELTDFLKASDNKHLFTSYSYRRSPDLVSQPQDCAVLDAALTMALDSQSLFVSEESEKQLRALGQSYFTFLRNRANHLSRTKLTEKYPHLSLLYDIYCAAFYRGKPRILTNVEDLLHTNYRSIIFSETFSKEVSLLERQQWEALNKILAQYISEKGEALDKYFAFRELADISHPPSIVLEMIMSGANRLHTGLGLIHGYSRSYGEAFPIQNPTVTRRVMDLYNIHKKRHLVRTPTDQEEIYERILKQVGRAHMAGVLSEDGIGADLATMLHRLIPSLGIVESLSADIQSALSDEERSMEPSQLIVKTRQKLGFGTTAADLFHYYLLLNWSEAQHTAEKNERENDWLWNQILDDCWWFVSPRGDRYSSERDPQLGNYGIHSVTFSTDQRYPREHKVAVRLSDNNTQFEFWLDKNKQLLSTQREVVVEDPLFKQAFLNLLLKRLYQITSGQLGTEQKLVQVEDAEGVKLLNLEYRRAFYRLLTSSEKRNYHLTSPSAVLHAQDILRDYGINIMDENKRRKDRGTLAYDNFITFVRELKRSEDLPWHALPNELTFRPDLLNIPSLS